MAARLIPALLLIVLTVSSSVPVPAQTGADPIAAATLLFTKYVNLERGYWPAVGDLYADEAVIRNRRKDPTGEVRELTLTAAQYRTRFSELKRYSSPLSLLVGRRADGRWMIYEELSESQP